ncbi:hypothetical protein OPQ81_000549 [Rhizoctonia solani]|nr:hypothetical protein OPQ81_000549 [Rhizoctonia solani]
MGGQRSSARVRNVIKAWLKATWGYDDFVSEAMPCGTQLNDETSCGVCAANTIEVQVFEDQLWDKDFALAYRASKFVQVVYQVLCSNESISLVSPPPLNISQLLAASITESIERGLLIDPNDQTHTPNPPSSPLPTSVPPSEYSNDDFHDGVSSDACQTVELDALTEEQTDNEASDNPEPVHQNHLVCIESDSDSSSGTSSESMKRPKKRQKPGKSAAHTRTVLEALRKGKFQIDNLRWARFEEAIKEFNTYAVVDRNDPLSV